ncbi:MAG: glycoside hydrolase family 19 protein [Bacteroidales bacterium]|nr:glycoside hydrolase family 19 protein [Bacteroidales bacterium]MBR4094748.1 glycoside hydrolase family 19 protein [Bacteroidales bacterium]
MRNEITPAMLADIFSIKKETAEPFVQHLKKYCREYRINTPERFSAFLAQIGHESGRLFYVEEIASGAAYEGRLDLGNSEPGDGVRYKGRGLIQLTGRFNYTILSDDTGIDFISNPQLLTEPQYAVMSACWYWNRHNLNHFADRGDLRSITKIINGGYNGLADRDYLYRRAKQYFVL